MTPYLRRAGVCLILLAALALAACRPAEDPAGARFDAWRASGGHAAEVEAYAAFLRAEGVADVVPLHGLLRSGRSWLRCGVDEFALPPRDLWPAMVPTLRLVSAMREARLLDGASAVSVYRTDGFNRCEGGSPRSRHRANAALDFDLAADADVVSRLCSFWQQAGPRHGFGLGFYDARRIHVDSTRHRTWGRDYTRATSLCMHDTQGFSAPDRPSADQAAGLGQRAGRYRSGSTGLPL